MRHQSFRLCVVITLALQASCSLTKAPALAESQVAQFHDRFNSGRYHDIYVDADEGFRKSGNEASFLEYLEAMRRKLGTVKEATRTAANVNASPSGTLVTLNYSVSFSEGNGTEQFVFRIVGEKALLYSYNVNSPVLITK